MEDCVACTCEAVRNFRGHRRAIGGSNDHFGRLTTVNEGITSAQQTLALETEACNCFLSIGWAPDHNVGVCSVYSFPELSLI